MGECRMYCINKSTDVEKTSQITKTANIYKRGSPVVACWGERAAKSYIQGVELLLLHYNVFARTQQMGVASSISFSCRGELTGHRQHQSSISGKHVATLGDGILIERNKSPFDSIMGCGVHGWRRVHVVLSAQAGSRNNETSTIRHWGSRWSKKRSFTGTILRGQPHT